MRILVTSDGSRAARRVVPHALRMASALDSEIVVLRVLDPHLDAAHITDPSLSAAMEQVRGTVRAEIDQECASWGHPVSIVVEEKERTEDIADTIIRVAKREAADIIAMDSRGRGAVKQALLGSVAMAIVGRDCVPVLLSGPRTEPPRGSGPYRVVVTDDGSPRARSVAKAVEALSGKSGVEFTFMRIYVPTLADGGERQEVAMAELAVRAFASEVAGVEDPKVVIGTCREFETLPHAILRVAKEQGSDAIVMSTRGHSALRQLLMGSAAHGVLTEAPIPIMLTRCT